jgi:SAM-dependent methyltransferase
MSISRQIRTLAKRIPGVVFMYTLLLNRYFIACQVELRALKSYLHYGKGRMLDVGCGGGPYRVLFPHVDSYVGIDILPSRNVDVVGDVQQLPFVDSTFDTILCTELLEHVPKPGQALCEISRLLKPGGTLLLTVPMIWGLHLEPYDFFRYTKYGLRYLAERTGLTVVEIAPMCGFWATWTQRFIDNVIEIYMRGCSAWLIKMATALLAPVSVTGYLFDALTGSRGDCLGNILVAIKPASDHCGPVA